MQVLLVDLSPIKVSKLFSGYDVVTVYYSEEATANFVRVNEFVMMRPDFPKNQELLKTIGYQTTSIDSNEAAKIDGSLSCMPLRFSLTSRT